MLSGVWRIDEAGDPPRALRPHEVVTNVEELCIGVIELQSRKLKEPLQNDDYLLSLEHLFERVVVVLPRYAPPPDRPGLQFRPWLFNELRWDLVDFWRSWFGRHGEKRIVDQRDNGLADEFDDDDGGAAASNQLVGALPSREGDLATSRSPELLRALLHPDRATLRAERGLGFSTDGRAAGGAPGARRRRRVAA